MQKAIQKQVKTGEVQEKKKNLTRCRKAVRQDTGQNKTNKDYYSISIIRLSRQTNTG